MRRPSALRKVERLHIWGKRKGLRQSHREETEAVRFLFSISTCSKSMTLKLWGNQSVLLDSGPGKQLDSSRYRKNGSNNRSLKSRKVWVAYGRKCRNTVQWVRVRSQEGETCVLGRQWGTDSTNNTKVALVGAPSNKQLEEGKTITKVLRSVGVWLFYRQEQYLWHWVSGWSHWKVKRKVAPGVIERAKSTLCVLMSTSHQTNANSCLSVDFVCSCGWVGGVEVESESHTVAQVGLEIWIPSWPSHLSFPSLGLHVWATIISSEFELWEGKRCLLNKASVSWLLYYMQCMMFPQINKHNLFH